MTQKNDAVEQAAVTAELAHMGCVTDRQRYQVLECCLVDALSFIRELKEALADKDSQVLRLEIALRQSQLAAQSLERQVEMLGLEFMPDWGNDEADF